MKTKTLLLLLPSALCTLNINAQEASNNGDDQLPSKLIVYKNPNVHGVRLDSIKTKLNNEYVSKVEYNYPEDGDTPTKQLAYGHTYYSEIPISYDTIINGVKLAKRNITYRDETSHDIISQEWLGKYLLKKTQTRKDVPFLTEEYKYNDQLEQILCLVKKYDTWGNISSGQKDTVIFENDYRIEINYKYNAVKKDFIAVKKTKTKTHKSDGWILEQYIYDADAEGNFGDCSYSIEMNPEFNYIDKEGYMDAITLGKMTVTENGEKITYNIKTDYYYRTLDEPVLPYYPYTTLDLHTFYDVFPYGNIKFSATYKANGDGGWEYEPFMVERYYTTFSNDCTKQRRYKSVNLIGTEENIKVECRSYDEHGFLSINYTNKIKQFSDAGKCLSILEHGDLGSIFTNNLLNFDYDYYEYAYLDGVNVGWTHHSEGGTGLIGGGGPQKCVRDLNYKNVKGSDGICPIIYSSCSYDWFPGTAYSIFYYSSEDGTIEPNVPTAICDTESDTKQTQTAIYDVYGKLVKTCASNHVTLPETSGIYIIRQNGKVIKMMKK